MQVHGPSEITDHIKVTHNPAGGFAALEVGTVSIFVYTAEEAARLTAAAAEVQRILTGEGDARFWTSTDAPGEGDAS
jgi:hypothetical protein